MKISTVPEITPGGKSNTHHVVGSATSVRGLGLIEVMISSFIICLAMLGVSRLHNTQVQIAHHQEHRLAAMALLDDKLADLRLIAHSGITDNAGVPTPVMKVSDLAGSVGKGLAAKAAGGKSADTGNATLIGNDRGGALVAGVIRYDQYTFQLHWTVAPIPDPAFKLLTVTVTWRDGQGKLLSVFGNTIISSLSVKPVS